MSQTVPPVIPPTSEQPHFQVANIWLHPGSSYAGIGLVMGIVAQAINAGSMPTSVTGWVVLVAGIAMSVAAAFGK